MACTGSEVSSTLKKNAERILHGFISEGWRFQPQRPPQPRDRIWPPERFDKSTTASEYCDLARALRGIAVERAKLGQYGDAIIAIALACCHLLFKIAVDTHYPYTSFDLSDLIRHLLQSKKGPSYVATVARVALILFNAGDNEVDRRRKKLSEPTKKKLSEPTKDEFEHLLVLYDQLAAIA